MRGRRSQGENAREAPRSPETPPTSRSGEGLHRMFLRLAQGSASTDPVTVPAQWRVGRLEYRSKLSWQSWASASGLVASPAARGPAPTGFQPQVAFSAIP